MKKFIIIISIIILSLNLAACKTTIKAGVVKNNEDRKKDTKEISYEDELDDMKKRLDVLAEKLISEKNDKDSINNILKGLKEEEQNIDAVYFAKEDTIEFFTYPEAELPEGYDARERPWYNQSKELEYYVSEPYKDIVTNNSMVTVTKAIYINEKLLGVIGIDLIMKGCK
ncbi:PDC sensor domain-containing protein [Lutibacter sp. B2]|nr:PDC sensor domain-containing protein [Lutibacter sp. B2]